MKSLNKVFLIGNVGNSPEIKMLNNDIKVARFSLATSETHKNKEGVKNTETQWHQILAWNSLAGIVEKYINKGDMLHITGKVQYRQYLDEESQTHYVTEIIAEEIIMLDKQKERE
jgi:single-strand DNA-binding protein